MSLSCYLVGVPVQSGTSQAGCLMGPDAFRTAGLAPTLESLGHRVTDHGNVAPASVGVPQTVNTAVHHLDETVGWALALQEVAAAAIERADFPIFLRFPALPKPQQVAGANSSSCGLMPIRISIRWKLPKAATCMVRRWPI
jgi:hypothetical protein